MTEETIPPGLKPKPFVVVFAARLKPCPFKTVHFKIRRTLPGTIFAESMGRRENISVAVSPHIIVYDGECPLCNRWVVFVLRHDPQEKFQFAALDSETARTHIPDPTQRDGSTLLLLTPEGVFTRSTAVLKIAGALDGFQTLARLALKIPQKLRDPIYAIIARHRHSLLPGKNACVLIPGVEDRFLP